MVVQEEKSGDHQASSSADHEYPHNISRQSIQWKLWTDQLTNAVITIMEMWVSEITD